jgi:hypothetical protein
MWRLTKAIIVSWLVGVLCGGRHGHRIAEAGSNTVRLERQYPNNPTNKWHCAFLSRYKRAITTHVPGAKYSAI